MTKRNDDDRAETHTLTGEGCTLPKRTARRVLLIGWDAADWKLIDPLVDQGVMPNMKRFLERGVRGSIASLNPMLSPMLWTSIATGKRADQHGILGFCEPDIENGSTRPVTSTSRQCLALWNILARRGLKAGAINWFASHPAETIRDGFIISDRWAHPTGPDPSEWKRVSGSIHPSAFADELNALRVHPAQITAEQVIPFVPSLPKLDFQREKRLHSFVSMLAHAASLQAATTYLMQEVEWDFLGVYFDEIDRVGHDFMEFHPPKMEHLDQDEFEKYKDVMVGTYRFHDMMLGRLLELAGEDTTVILVSDHGFHSNDLRPEGSSQISAGNPVGWHRPYGVIAACGPHIKAGEQIYGSSLLDIAPTVLAMLGLPVPDDMEGQVLLNMFDGVPEFERKETYEDGSPNEAPDADDDPWAAREMMVQLAALGYVEDDSVEGVVRDRQRNLGITYFSKGQYADALAVFDELIQGQDLSDSHRADVHSLRAQCLLSLGEFDACSSIVEELDSANDSVDGGSGRMGHWVERMRAQLARSKGDQIGALARFRAIAEAQPNNPAALIDYGVSLLSNEQWQEAIKCYERSIEIDPDNADAWDGAGTAYYNLEKRDEAIFSFVRSISLQHVKPRTHFKLGIVLAEVGRVVWARKALETALEQHPGMVVAHRALARLLRGRFDDETNALEHERIAKELLRHQEEYTNT